MVGYVRHIGRTTSDMGRCKFTRNATTRLKYSAGNEQSKCMRQKSRGCSRHFKRDCRGLLAYGA
eukprot:2844066-Lingulodinium_polyedra.AAC.1